MDPDLVNTLIELVGGNPDCVRFNVSSPLWHTMNFELMFDKTKQDFVPLSDESETIETIKISNIKKSSNNLQHIAVMKLHEDKYVINTKKLISSISKSKLFRKGRFLGA